MKSLDIYTLSCYNTIVNKTKGSDNIGMTDKLFNGFVRFILDDILEVLENMPEGQEKNKLQKLADNLQTILED